MNGRARPLAPFLTSLSTQRIRSRPRVTTFRTLATPTTLRSATNASARIPVLKRNSIQANAQPTSNLVNMASEASGRKNVHLVVLVHGLWGESFLISLRTKLTSLQATPSTSALRAKSWKKHTKKPKKKPVSSNLPAVSRNCGSSSHRAMKAHIRTMESMSAPGGWRMRLTERSRGSRRMARG
jgi:hypothetical protein